LPPVSAAGAPNSRGKRNASL